MPGLQQIWLQREYSSVSASQSPLADKQGYFKNQGEVSLVDVSLCAHAEHWLWCPLNRGEWGEETITTWTVLLISMQCLWCRAALASSVVLQFLYFEALELYTPTGSISPLYHLLKCKKCHKIHTDSTGGDPRLCQPKLLSHITRFSSIAGGKGRQIQTPSFIWKHLLFSGGFFHN